MDPKNLVLIDGSLLEGGGQVLRNSIALSALTGRPIKIVNIRAARSKPGLRAQHLKGIELVAEMYQAALTGGSLHSTKVLFEPGKFEPKAQFCADIQTAGSICLLIQTCLPPLLYSGYPNQVLMKGGTNAAAAPQIDYFQHVFLPLTKKHFGLDFSLNVARRGYFPKGGGLVELETKPLNGPIPAINLTDRGHVVRVWIRSFVAGLHSNINIRTSNTALRLVKDFLRHAENDTYRNIEFELELVNEDQYIGRGTGILIVAETSTGCLLAGSALGEKKMPAELVGEIAAKMLIEDLEAGGCVDQHMQDQLIIWMALAKGKSIIKTGPLTLHTETAIHFASLLTKAKFQVCPEETEGEVKTVLIECHGTGFCNKPVN